MKHGTHTTYIAGFILSVLLTLAAYLPVYIHVSANHATLPHEVIIPIIVGLAVVQLLVQLVLFLHLGSEPRPRWNLMTTLFAAMVVVIIVFGSLWIMGNLDYHHPTPPDQLDHSIMQDEGVHL